MLGDLLRQKREEKQLSLEDIENGTNIRKLYIKSIEIGDYKRIPGEVFLKGFIKSYSKFLGLDPLEIIKIYENEKNHSKNIEIKNSNSKKINTIDTNSKKDESSSNSKNKIKSKQTKIYKNSIEHSLNSNNSNKKETKSLDSKIILIAVFLISLVLGYGGYTLLNQKSDDNIANKNQTTVESKSTIKENASPKDNQEIVLSVHFTRDCWSEVSVDGEEVLAKTIKKGSTMTWKGTKNITVMFANASAIEITLNGKKLDKVAAPGSIVEKTFLPDGSIK